MDRSSVRARLKMLPQIMETTVDGICRRLAISRKRWKEIRRRELDIATAQLIAEEFDLTLDWLWAGRMDSLSVPMRKRIADVLDEAKQLCE